jgi:23S rRNA (adenine2030-N6)-methyltransferase
MNYRHAFHAGNFADVMKHAALCLMLAALSRKDKPFFVLDTHAGIGAYDLAAGEAGRTGEYLGGIARVLDAADPPAELMPYLELVRGMNPDGGLRHYPGSPEVTVRMMRATDRLAAVELHPADVDLLRRRYGRDRRVGVHHLDGHVAAKGLLPPPERRGLVLIDPPFEEKDELARLTRTLAGIRKRWAGGTVAVWYPIKDQGPVAQFHRAACAAGAPPTLAVELLVHPCDTPFRLNGSGLLVINPPWRFDQQMTALLPWLAETLAPGRGGWRVDWLVAEDGGQSLV